MIEPVSPLNVMHVHAQATMTDLELSRTPEGFGYALRLICIRTRAIIAIIQPTISSNQKRRAPSKCSNAEMEARVRGDMAHSTQTIISDNADANSAD
jgi:hypothetical protein